MSEGYLSYEEAPQPLTDKERSLLKRMFSDFFEVPSEWKAAMKAELERDPPVLGMGTLGGAFPSNLLVGEIKAYPFGEVPDAHWAFCDGQTVFRSLGTHKRLHDKVAAIGYPSPFGPGDGTTTWTLPNLKGRVMVHKDGGDADWDVVGEMQGAKTHTLVTGEMPYHTHTLTAFDGGTPGALVGGATGGGGNTNVTGSAGGSGSHNNLQPSIVVPMIIYLG